MKWTTPLVNDNRQENQGAQELSKPLLELMTCITQWEEGHGSNTPIMFRAWAAFDDTLSWLFALGRPLVDSIAAIVIASFRAFRCHFYFYFFFTFFFTEPHLAVQYRESWHYSSKRALLLFLRSELQSLINNCLLLNSNGSFLCWTVTV